ncbi:MAG: hypothetical protein P4L39_09660 [Humidesulfovibrio sp.]|nr:hypothetical protein [Humidesulfovibrio sp.]
MKQTKISKQALNASLYLAIVFALAIFAMGCNSSTVAAASSDVSSFDGVWQGETPAGKTTAKVTLTLQPKTPTLQYGSPRNCKLILETPVINDHSSEYGITTANGGFCKDLEFGKLLLQLADDGKTLTYEARDMSGAPLDKGTLRHLGK